MTARPGSCSTAAVRSAEGTGICSASISLRTHSMLRIGHLPSRLSVGIILVQLWCPIGLVTTVFSIIRACGSDIATTPKSLISLSFIRLSWTVSRLCTLSWIIRSPLCISSGVEHSTVSAERLVWLTTWYALEDCGLAAAAMVSLFAHLAQVWCFLHE